MVQNLASRRSQGGPMGEIINVLDWYHGQRSTKLVHLRVAGAGDEPLRRERAGELSSFIERWLPVVNHIKRQQIRERESTEGRKLF
ncbi:MAG: hypothetical protein P8182_20475 [Deltaproteobacteria bacterium]